jgi:hypothetical protein
MDWTKLIGLSAIVFMAIEILKVKFNSLTEKVTRVLVLIAVILASVGLGYTAPVLTTVKCVFVLNSFLYFITEYFIYLFLRNELKVSIKNLILSITGNSANKTPVTTTKDK